MLLPCLGLLDAIDVYNNLVSATVINIVESSLIVGISLGNSRIFAGVEACAADGIVDVDSEMVDSDSLLILQLISKTNEELTDVIYMILDNKNS